MYTRSSLLELLTSLLLIQGLKIPQKFTVIKGLSYNLLLGINFINHTHAFIDFRNKTLSVCDDLVVEHLLPSKTPTNVIKTTSSYSIAPLSEAIIPVTSNTACDGSFLTEPLPFLHNKHVSLAHAVVSVNKQHYTLMAQLPLEFVAVAILHVLSLCKSYDSGCETLHN